MVRTRVRLKQQAEIYQSVPLAEAGLVDTRHGTRHGYAGDLQITRDSGEIIELLSPDLLATYFEVVPPVEPLVLGPEAITRLGKILEIGATRSVDALVGAVERLSNASIGGVEIVWSPAEQAAIKHRAQKMGLTPEALIKRLLDKFLQDFWTT